MHSDSTVTIERPVLPAARHGQGLTFAHLNLRRNPFGELGQDDRPGVAVVDLAPLLGELRNPAFALQVVGEQGFGKTTHLLTIRAAIVSATYTCIPEGRSLWPSIGNPTIVDEAQRLSRRHRFRLFRRGVPLALGTHENLERELQQAGRTVVTLQVGELMTLDRLHTILNRRITFARRGPGPLPSIRLATTKTLLEEFGSNVRAIEAQLYDCFQNLREIQNV